jgi:hypothetical protein
MTRHRLANCGCKRGVPRRQVRCSRGVAGDRTLYRLKDVANERLTRDSAFAHPCD